MKHNLLSNFKTFGLGLKDGILILIILAAISPFVYGEVLERTASTSNVVIGSLDVDEADLPTRPSTPTPEPSNPTTVPTPTSSPTPQPTKVSASSPQVVDGGFIQLHVEGIRPGLWTQVQWLAGDGKWYDVNGWGGHLTQNNDVLWFVGKNHLGAEPVFRWLAYDQEGGSLLAMSNAFYLPELAKQTVEVTLIVPSQ